MVAIIAFNITAMGFQFAFNFGRAVPGEFFTKLLMAIGLGLVVGVIGYFVTGLLQK